MSSRVVTRRALIGSAAAGTIAAVTAALWPSSSRPRSSKPPRPTPVAARWLTFSSNPANNIFVSWSAGPKAKHRPTKAAIRWGLSPTTENNAFATTRQLALTSPPGALSKQQTYYSRARLSDLHPDTLYYYAVTSDGRTWTPDATFRTAPAQRKPFRFTAFGDQAAHQETSLQMSRLVAHLGSAFHLVAGDLSYASAAGGDTDPSSATFDPAAWDRYVEAITYAAASVPWVPVVGSHEIEPFGQHAYTGFVTRFPQHQDLSSGSPVVRHFVYGNVAVVQLDGNDVSQQERDNAGYTNGRQTRWLNKTLDDLRNATPGVEFIVVLCNISAYSSNTTHGSDGGVREEWVPLFDRYQVDLVISGHVHAYERSHPMRAGKRTSIVLPGGRSVPAKDGTTYICAGGGGNGLYKTWFGLASSGDATTTSGSVPKVWTLDPATQQPRHAIDGVTNFSAHRQAAYSCLVIDSTPGDGVVTNSTLRVQAVMPEQSVGAVTSFDKYQVIDSIHLVYVPY